MTVTYKEYAKDLRDFSQKHNKKADLKIFTSPMVNDRYHKEYCWSDGATFYEINERVIEIAEAEVHGITVKVPVEMWRTEYWSTESSSKYYYEKI